MNVLCPLDILHYLYKILSKIHSFLPLFPLLTNFHIQLKAWSCSPKKLMLLKVLSLMKLKEVPTRQVFRKEMKENTNARLHLTYLRTPFKHTRQQTKNKPRPHKMYQLFRQIYSSCDLGVQEIHNA